MQSGWRKKYFRYKDYFLNIYLQYKDRKDVLIFLELGLSLAVISIFSIFAIKPTAITIIELLKTIKTKEEVIAKMDAKIKNLNQARLLFREQHSNISLLDSVVPSKPAPEDFLRQIEIAALVNNTNIQNVSLDEVVIVEDKEKTENADENTPANFNRINFTASFSADFPSLHSLLNSLVNLRRPIKIDSLTIAKDFAAEEEMSSDLNLTLVGQVPYLTKEKALTNEEE